MVSRLFFYQLTLIALVWLCLMLHWMWPSASAACPTLPEPLPPRPKRQRAPTPFAGLTTKPHCDACAHATDSRPPAPSAPPPRIVPTRGRRRQVDTSTHFCPNPDCAYRGWVGWGNLRANGHPNGGPWRQLYGTRCEGSSCWIPGSWMCRCRTTQLLSPFPPGSLSFSMAFNTEVRFSDHGGA